MRKIFKNENFGNYLFLIKYDLNSIYSETCPCGQLYKAVTRT